MTKSDIIFLSVPTPSNLDGSMNIDIVDKALTDIDEHDTNAVILLRSTVVPGTTNKLQDKYPNLRLVFNPEFLTERSANFDFINQDRVILGGDINDVEVAESLFKSRFGSTISILKTNYGLEFDSAIQHKNVYGAGELSFLKDAIDKKLSINNDNSNLNAKNLTTEIFQEIRNYYLDKIKIFENPEEYLIDKAPLNFKWIGFITTIFPNSKIITIQNAGHWLHAENPIDFCKEVFKHLS